MARNELRTLYLDNEPRLGERLDDDCFEVHWEFWLQISMLRPSLDAESVVTSDDAEALADFICKHIDDDGWQTHLAAWGDEGGKSIRAFVEFLRGGGFVVLDLNRVLPQD